MDQAARNGALLAFKRGQLRILVATDVAARGIDVHNVLRVVHLDVPSNADSYTHRSGRTGRAGRKGTSVLLVTPQGLRRSERVLNAAGVQYRLEPVPSARVIESSQDDRWLASLEAGIERAQNDRVQRQLERILAAGQTEVALANLLSDLHQTQGQPRSIDAVALRPKRGGESRVGAQPFTKRKPFERQGAARGDRRWVSFNVSCGRLHGADPGRLVAMLCRRGKIKGRDLGAIRVGAKSSEVEVAEEVAAGFARAASAPDPRNPRVSVAPSHGGAPMRDVGKDRASGMRVVKGFERSKQSGARAARQPSA
jgi:ATP-dependent RNA helicase DeaD